jgi:cysteine-S-conjugate beta-lyase
MNFATRLIAFDTCPNDPNRPTATPIYQTATFEQDSALEFGRYDYARSGNPTRRVLEDLIADLEGGTRGFAFASGLAAITAVTRLLKPGDEILACEDLYGGAFRLFSRILTERGIRVRYADFTAEGPLPVSPATKLVYLETPSNPLLKITDIRKVASEAHAAGALLCVDGTAMTSYLQRPLELGADLVLHSATKYLSGHADVTAGVVTVKDQALAERIYFIQNGEGAVLGPQDCFLLLRGLKTLSLRLDRQQQTAQQIAEWLVSLPLPEGGGRGEGLSSPQRRRITRVHFPGLRTHPGHDLHLSQALGPGAVVSFETGDPDFSVRLVEALKLFSIAVSFGGVGSSATVPCRMSHAPIAKAADATIPKPATQPPPDLIRLSIGIEHPADLLADLAQAFEASQSPQRQEGRTHCASLEPKPSAHRATSLT